MPTHTARIGRGMHATIGQVPVRYPVRKRLQRWFVATCMGLKAGGTRGSLRNVSTGASTIPDSVVSRDPDDATSADNTDTLGIRIETSAEWSDIQARLSGNVANQTRAYVYAVSDGSLMGDTDVSSLTAGESFKFGLDNPLQPNTQYNVVVDAEGSAYDVGFDDDPSFPYTSTDGNLSIINGAKDAQQTAGNAQNIDQIGNLGL